MVFWLLIFRQNLFSYTSNISLPISELPLLCANKQTWIKRGSFISGISWLFPLPPASTNFIWLCFLLDHSCYFWPHSWMFHFSAEGRGYLPVPRSTRCPVTHLGFFPYRHQYPFFLIKCFCLPPKFICWSPHPSVTLLEDKPLEGNRV